MIIRRIILCHYTQDALLCIKLSFSLLALGWLLAQLPGGVPGIKRAVIFIPIPLYVYIYIYICIYIYIYIYNIYNNIYIYIYIYIIIIYVSLSLSLSLYIYIHIDTCTYIHVSPAKKCFTNFMLNPFVIKASSTNWLGHGHGYERHSSEKPPKAGRGFRQRSRGLNPGLLVSVLSLVLL